MSEEIKEFRSIKNKPRSKKLHPRIDLAAMISISFLLIIFFMVNRELSRPQSMDLGLPDRTCGGCGGGGCNLDFRRTITLLLDDDNKVISYRGLLEVPEDAPSKLSYGQDIRKTLLEMKKKVEDDTGDYQRGAIVLIKPSKKSNYGNLVDILDEMTIAEIPTYAIVNDFTPQELKLLASK